MVLLTALAHNSSDLQPHHRDILQQISRKNGSHRKVQVKGQTHPTPYRTRTPATVLKRHPEVLIFPKLRATPCFWRTGNIWQRAWESCHTASTHTLFILNLGDEFFFDVMVWGKSLLFFCNMWRRSGVSPGRKETSHIRQFRATQTAGRCQIRPGQSTPGVSLNSLQSWTSQPLAAWDASGELSFCWFSATLAWNGSRGGLQYSSTLLSHARLSESCHLLLLKDRSCIYNTYRTYTTVNTLRGVLLLMEKAPEVLTFFWAMKTQEEKQVRPASTYMAYLQRSAKCQGSRIKGQRTLLNCPRDKTRHSEICPEKISCLLYTQGSFCPIHATSLQLQFARLGAQAHCFWAAASSGTATACRTGQIYWKQWL